MKESIYFVTSAVIFIIAGVAQVTSDCLIPYENCKISDIVLPVTTEEVEPFCSETFDFLDCYRNNVVTCGSHQETLNFIDRMISYYKDFCNNSLPLQQAVMNNAVCMSTTTHDKKCYTFEIEEDKVIKANETLQQNGIPEVTFHENFTAQCILSLYTYTCISETIRGNCGETAAHAILEAYKKLWYPFETCNAEIVNYLPQIIQLFKESVNELTEETETEDLERLLTEESFAFEDMAI